jgi:hypothetical protein
MGMAGVVGKAAPIFSGCDIAYTFVCDEQAQP